MVTVKARVVKYKSSFEVTVDRESNQLIGEALLYKGESEEKALGVLQSILDKKGIQAKIVVTERAGTNLSAQEAAYQGYRAKGGTLPLSLYLGG